jgi:PAS domain S-box-containing protein
MTHTGKSVNKMLLLFYCISGGMLILLLRFDLFERFIHANMHQIQFVIIKDILMLCITAALFYILYFAWKRKRKHDISLIENNLESISGLAGDARLIIDCENGNIVDVNDNGCHMFEYAHDEMLSQSIAMISENNDEYALKNALVLFDKSRDIPQTFDWHARRKDGSLFWVEINMHSMGLNKKKFIIASLRDVSKRKRIEEALKKERDFSVALLDSIPGLVYLYDSKGRLVRWNKKHEELTGYSAEELAQMKLTDWYKGDDETIALITSRVGDALREGFADAEAWLQTKDGGKILFYFTAVKLEIENEIFFAGTGINITERKKTEEALRRSEEMLRGITKNIPGMVYQFHAAKDGSYKLNYVSERSVEYLGIENSNLEGTFEKFVEGIVEEDRSRFISSVNESVISISPWECEGKYIKPDGQEMYFRGVSQPRMLNDELVFDGIILDNTEKRRAEKAFFEKASEFEWLLNSMANAFVMWETVFDEKNILVDVRFVYFNEAYEKIAGLKLEQLRNRTISEIWPESEHRWYDVCGRVALSGIPESFEMFHEPTKGMYVCHAYRPWETTDRMCVVFEDIAERRKADEEIKNLAELNKTILDTITAGISYVIERKQQWVNASFLRIFGYQSNESTNIKTSQFYANIEDYENIGKYGYAHLSKGGVYSAEIQMKKKDGSLFWCHLVGKALDPENISKGSIWMLQDITTRKKAELALHQSEMILKATMESINDGIIVVSSDGFVTHSNNQFWILFSITDKMVSIDEKLLFDRYISSQIHDYERFLHRVEEINNSDSKTEDILYLKNGQVLECLSYPLKEDSPVKGRVWLFRDITERKQREEELRNSEAEFRSLFESIPSGALMAVERKFRKVSSKLSSITGYSAEELINQSTRMIYCNEEEYEHVGTELYSSMEREGLGKVETRIQKKDGTVIDVLMCASPLVPGDASKGISATLEDISERKRAERSLQKFQYSIDQASDAVFWMNKDGRFSYVNEQACRSLGYTREELMRLSLWDIDLDYPIQKWKSKWSDYQNVDRGGEYLETIHRRKDGVSFPVEVVSTHIKFPEDELHISVSRDITERKKWEEQIRVLNADLENRVKDRTRELEEKSKVLQDSLQQLEMAQQQLIISERMAAIGSLVAGVAHEINTPLGVGVTAATLIEKAISDFKNDVIKKEISISKITTMANTLTETVQLLVGNLAKAAELIQSFKRVAVDQTSGEKRRFNLKMYLDDIIQSLHHQYHKTDIRFIVECRPDLIVETFAGAVSQVFTNLICNSLLHAFPVDHEEVIRIKIELNEKNIGIEYSDNGKGIMQDSIGKIYEPFYTTKRNEGGSGLGLHIVFKIITEQLRGTIACESKPDQGTRFIMKIPLESMGL